MSKSFLSLVQSRATVYEFSTRGVSDSNLKKILEAGQAAPSFMNLQPWEFIVVKQPKAIEAIVKSAKYGFYSAREHSSFPPVLVALVLKEGVWEDEFGKSGTETPGIFEQYLTMGMPAHSMLLEAEDLGLSTCLLSVQTDEAKQLLRVPENDRLLLVVGIGYKKASGKQKKRSRKSLKEIVSYDYSGKK